jgi:hypothetical protein
MSTRTDPVTAARAAALDYPELASARMAWARTVAESLRHHAVVFTLRRPAPRAELVLAA